jgi:DNA-binding CsgD family transcriptional regulator
MAWLQYSNGERFFLTGSVVSIGRDATQDVHLVADRKVSRSHAQLEHRDGQWIVVDLGSVNGTKIGARRIDRHPLRDGDRIQIGTTTLTFIAGDDENATEADMERTEPELVFSNRESQILALISQGLTDQAIADQLFISASTVRSHLERIRDKTGLRRRSELTRLAIGLGIVT